MLEPTYSSLVDSALDKIEYDPSRRPLWNAICDAIDLVCDQPDSADARREQVRTPTGLILWQVPVWCRAEDDDWVLLWHRDDDARSAVIVYIGPDRFR